MSDVTDADRERAHEVLGYSPSTPRTYTAYEYARVTGVAAALAEERSKARAPFREILAEWDRADACMSEGQFVRRIRRAAEVTE